MELVFSNPEILDRLIAQIQHRNISECITRLITFEANSLPEGKFLVNIQLIVVMGSDGLCFIGREKECN